MKTLFTGFGGFDVPPHFGRILHHEKEPPLNVSPSETPQKNNGAPRDLSRITGVQVEETLMVSEIEDLINALEAQERRLSTGG